MVRDKRIMTVGLLRDTFEDWLKSRRYTTSAKRHFHNGELVEVEFIEGRSTALINKIGLFSTSIFADLDHIQLLPLTIVEKKHGWYTRP